ncbi:cytochrome P460 family protein [Pelagibius sp. Alg239-R121]|uniref:cytochrome P460 family protein n=1 Tax=Pelagibius sp. Alg239-R121 TaxID=2993448 RepID=UPI0024A61CB7|nr:cytochrome P460 family protein [Pelagibius sp. Alg239-R121]
MRNYLLSTAIVCSLLAGVTACSMTNAADDAVTPAIFAADGQVMIPKDWRQWVYVGTPLTPNALNDGKAPFPEFHNVYIEPTAFAHWQSTGKFANGTQIVKELVLIRQKDADEMNEDGSTGEVSGVGYFQGEFAGLELTVKDTTRYPDEPGGWAYYSFGHNSPPYADTAKAFPTEACNACHETNAADDFVFTQFYPVLRAAKP